MRILVVEDEKRLNKILSATLEDEGYSVDSCYDGLEAEDYVFGAEYDVIVLDVNLPGQDGFSFVESIRKKGYSSPVLFLTARDSLEDRVTGLERGGDYYLTKPFEFPELLAVIRVMTRKKAGNRTNQYTIADLTLDTAAKTVTRGGKQIELTAKEFSMLEYFMRNQGVVLTREMIEDNLSNYDYDGGTNVVDVYIGYLRKKMDRGFDQKLIHTVWGTGWVMREE